MIPARRALVYSYNLPAVRTFEAFGTRTGVAYPEKMGISTITPEEVENLSLTLGGFHLGVSAVDMAQAYGVLANQGQKVDLHTVERIIDRQGNIIYEFKADPEKVLSPQAAFLVNNILQEFVTAYLCRELRIDRQVAAKTGTADDWRDVYLVAYTPNLVASFWMGYDEPRMGSIEQGWRYSTKFLREVFLEAFETLEIKEFEEPEGIVRLSVCSKSGLRPTSDCSEAGTIISDHFIADMAPTAACDMHVDGFYNRPPFITTDHRWPGRGGAGRGPEDAEELPSDEVAFGSFSLISQPHFRPIVRCKARTNVEFGAKLAISIVDGLAYLKKLAWDNFHEAMTLPEAIERYRLRHGFYPAYVHVDKIYHTRDNILCCLERGIRISGPKLGRPPKEPDPEARKQAYQDALDRNVSEGKFEEGKRRYGLDLIKEKLQQTSEKAIMMNLIVMNLAYL